VVPPRPGANWFLADFGAFRLRFERHTEFTGWNFLASDVDADHPFARPAIAHLPPDWLAKLPGQAIAATHMLRVLKRPSQVVIGLRPDPQGGEWDSHAWVTTESGTVIGGEVAQEFTAVTVYRKGPHQILPSGSASPAALVAMISYALSRDLGFDLSPPTAKVSEDFLQTASRHRVDSLLTAYAENLPFAEDVRLGLRERATASSFAGLRLVHNTNKVVAVLKEYKIDFLVFKGVTLSLLSGREWAARGAGDIDVLVKATDVPHIHRILISEGFAAKVALTPREGPAWRFWSFRERELSYHKDDIWIDLHWRIPKNPRHCASTQSHIIRAIEVSEAEHKIPTLSPGDALNACAIHIYLDYCQNLRQIVDLVYLSNIPGVVLPVDVPPPGQALVADVLEFARRLLDPKLIPDVPGVPEYSEKGVRYLLGMWEINSGRSLLESGPAGQLGEGVGRLLHWTRYGLTPTELMRFISWAFFGFPPSSPERSSTTVLQAFTYRVRQVLLGRLPYLAARRQTSTTKLLKNSMLS
jgi:hypothetical protein